MHLLQEGSRVLGHDCGDFEEKIEYAKVCGK